MFRKSILLFIFVSCLAISAISANAATYFTANLNGTQTVPASGSSATGFGRITLNDAEDQITVSIYYGNPSALTGVVTSAHIHGPANMGVTGPVIFDLNPATGATSGSVVRASFFVTSAQVADLKAGLWYINIHTNNFSEGEIRGQLLVDSPFIAYIDNNQEIPPTSSTARGSGFVSLNEATSQALITLNWSNLSSPVNGAQLYAGGVGTNGSAVCNLAPPAAVSGSVIDKLCTLSPEQVQALKQAQLYLNVQTKRNLDGEIRGQIQRRASAACDYDGDGATDAAIIRANFPVLEWWIRNSSNGSSSAYTFGLYSDYYYRHVVCGDYDGDGKDDLAFWRPAPAPDAFFYIFQSASFTVREVQFGATGDDPRVVEDYDGDAVTDIAVFRQSEGNWYYLGSSNNPNKKLTVVRWGAGYANPGDFDGDGRGDFVDEQGSNWWILNSSDLSYKVVSFGGPALKWGTPGDYDGDGKTDVGISTLEGGNMVWYYLSSVDPAQNPYLTKRFWGGSGAELPIRVQGDYDGDGRTDYAVYFHAELPTDTPKFWILPSNGAPPVVIPWGRYTPPTAYADFPVASYNSH